MAAKATKRHLESEFAVLQIMSIALILSRSIRQMFSIISGT